MSLVTAIGMSPPPTKSPKKKTLELAGANAIQIEDQVLPKKCGHFSGKAVISKQEMVDKIKSALDARRSEDCLIMAPTDSRAIEGFESGADRCRAYREVAMSAKPAVWSQASPTARPW